MTYSQLNMHVFLWENPEPTFLNARAGFSYQFKPEGRRDRSSYKQLIRYHKNSTVRNRFK